MLGSVVTDTSERPFKRIRSILVDPTHNQAGQDGANQHLTDSCPDGLHNEREKPRRGRPQKSCAECRRARVNCNKVFPCNTCKKRGCAEICPEGTLISVKESRTAIVNNEQLQQKLVQLARRIMKLEDALSSLHEIHSRCASAGSYPGTSLQWDVLLPHPLLTVENRKIKDLSELSISVRILENLQMTSEDGSIPYLAEPVVALDHLHASFLEKSMSMSETIVIGFPETECSISNTIATRRVTLPTSLLEDARKYLDRWKKEMEKQYVSKNPASGPRVYKASIDVKERALALMPIHEEAVRLCKMAVRNSFWMLNYVVNDITVETLLISIYRNSDVETIDSGDLALIIMLIGIGAFVYTENRQECTTPRVRLDYWDCYAMSRAVLHTYVNCSRASTTRIAQCLFLYAWYEHTLSRENLSAEQARNFVEQLAGILKSLNLHEEDTYQKMGDKKVALELRFFFWEVLYLDYAISIRFRKYMVLDMDEDVSCGPPARSSLPSIVPTDIEASCIDAMFNLVQNIAEPILLEGVDSDLRLEEIVNLDSRIRCCFDTERIFNRKDTNSYSPPPEPILSALYATFSQTRAMYILYLHQARMDIIYTYNFRSLLSTAEHIHVLATLHSACAITSSFAEALAKQPKITMRMSNYWHMAFCAFFALLRMLESNASGPEGPFVLNEVLKFTDLLPRAMEYMGVLDEDTLLRLLTDSTHAATLRILEWKYLVEKSGIRSYNEQMSKKNCAFQRRTQRILGTVSNTHTGPLIHTSHSASGINGTSGWMEWVYDEEETGDEAESDDEEALANICKAAHPELIAFLEKLPEQFLLSQKEVPSLIGNALNLLSTDSTEWWERANRMMCGIYSNFRPRLRYWVADEGVRPFIEAIEDTE